MDEVSRLCSTVLMMKQGRIVDRGTPQDLLRRYNRDDLEDVFLDIARSRAHPDGVTQARHEGQVEDAAA
jgi:ABC-2 type transport system ATP-binding protein